MSYLEIWADWSGMPEYCLIAWEWAHAAANLLQPSLKDY